VGQIHEDHTGDFSGSDTEHDKRRVSLPFYDAVSDPAALGEVMDPISAETGANHQEELNQTPASANISSRDANSTAGTVTYNNIGIESQRQSVVQQAAKKKSKASQPGNILWPFALHI
jgi:hypothetical protein